jgi:hypothetical protein
MSYTPNIEIIPPAALQNVVAVLLDGAEKHTMYGWRYNPRSWLAEWEAAMRHQKRWLAGENNDADSGLHPIAHASTRLLILLDNILNERGTDDRAEWEVTP